MSILPILIFFVLLWPLIYLVRLYNKAVSTRNIALMANGAIASNSMKYRNTTSTLLTIAKRHAEHEQSLLEKLLSQTNNLTTGLEGEAYTTLMNLAQFIIGLQEEYPELSSDDSFAFAAKSLSHHQGDLRAAMLSYNEAGRQYNDQIEELPLSLFASLFGLFPISLYEEV